MVVCATAAEIDISNIIMAPHRAIEILKHRIMFRPSVIRLPPELSASLL